MKHSATANRPAMPEVLETAAALRAFTARERAQGRKIALVPTMGALHTGHLQLVEEAKKQADRVIVSIFVNPSQFGPNEDFAAYPRTWDADRDKLAAVGAAAIFHPGVDDIYPPGFATTVTVSGVSEPLEGERRPGHFAGVATVVARLLLLAAPDIALFGEKDWQQLQVIRRMVADLGIPAEIVGVPTVRDENGLALSSRNAYLSDEQYRTACALNRILFAMAQRLRAGDGVEQALGEGRKALDRAGFDSVDYLEIRDAQSLAPPSGGDLRILAAVRCGRARLIDNVAV